MDEAFRPFPKGNMTKVHLELLPVHERSHPLWSCWCTDLLGFLSFSALCKGA